MSAHSLEQEFLTRIMSTSVINPHATNPSHFQHRWRINVWAGIIGDKILGPCFLNQTMNGENYLRFLREELSGELDELNLDLVLV